MLRKLCKPPTVPDQNAASGGFSDISVKINTKYQRQHSRFEIGEHFTMNLNCRDILKWTETQLKYKNDVTLKEATPRK